MSLTLDAIAAICQPHNEKIVAEYRADEALKALEQIAGILGACVVQRSPSDDKIIAEHIEECRDIASAAATRLRRKT